MTILYRMKRETLVQQIFDKQSFLCVGLDTDLQRVPTFLRNTADPIFEFNKQIIDYTKDHCVAYKPNIAFYESLGPEGWISLEKTLDYIPDTHFTIADAKRGDIGNTSQMYARTFFEKYQFDAVTVAPYMGRDSVLPFLEFEDKWVIVLALTSNQGSHDFQLRKSTDDRFLYEQVLDTAQRWGNPDNLMFVIGATQATSLQKVRSIVPDHFLLVPGVGSQGGDLGAVYQHGKNDSIGLLVNASRSIIYAGADEHFGVAAAGAARLLAGEMKTLMAE